MTAPQNIETQVNIEEIAKKARIEAEQGSHTRKYQKNMNVCDANNFRYFVQLLEKDITEKSRLDLLLAIAYFSKATPLNDDELLKKIIETFIQVIKSDVSSNISSYIVDISNIFSATKYLVEAIDNQAFIVKNNILETCANFVYRNISLGTIASAQPDLLVDALNLIQNIVQTPFYNQGNEEDQHPILDSLCDSISYLFEQLICFQAEQQQSKDSLIEEKQIRTQNLLLKSLNILDSITIDSKMTSKIVSKPIIFSILCDLASLVVDQVVLIHEKENLDSKVLPFSPVALSLLQKIFIHSTKQMKDIIINQQKDESIEESNNKRRLLSIIASLIDEETQGFSSFNKPKSLISRFPINKNSLMKPKIIRKARKIAGRNRVQLNLQVVRSMTQIFKDIRHQYKYNAVPLNQQEPIIAENIGDEIDNDDKNIGSNSQHPIKTATDRSKDIYNQHMAAEEINLLDEGFENEGIWENFDMHRISQSQQLCRSALNLLKAKDYNEYYYY